MTPPLVSVVIPSFNCASYVTEAIASVLRQTHPSCEIIVVDDGSTDQTAGVVSEMAAAGQIRYARQHHQGAGAARNAGIRLATGDYIAFLDADDTLEPDSVERRLRLLRSCPDLGLAFSDVYWEPRPDERVLWVARWGVVERLIGTAARRAEHGIVFGPSFADAFDILSHALTNAVLIKREVFTTVGLFRTDLPFLEDQDMWYRIGQRYQIGYVPTPLATWKQYRGFLTTRLASERQLSYLTSKIAVYERVLEGRLHDRSRTWLRTRLSWLYLDLAYLFRERNLDRDARRCAVRSLRYRPWNQAAYQTLLLPLVPGRLRTAAKRVATRYRTAWS